LLMMLVRRADVMDRFVIAGPLLWLGWMATGVMAVSVVGMAIGFLL